MNDRTLIKDFHNNRARHRFEIFNGTKVIYVCRVMTNDLYNHAWLHAIYPGISECCDAGYATKTWFSRYRCECYIWLDRSLQAYGREDDDSYLYKQARTDDQPVPIEKKAWFI